MFAQKSVKYVKNKPKPIVVAGFFKLASCTCVLLFSSVSCQLHDMYFVSLLPPSSVFPSPFLPSLPLSFLPLSSSLLLYLFILLSGCCWIMVVMQDNSPPLCLHPLRTTSPQNFAEKLPTEMSLQIFGELDAISLCSASQTCRLWYHIIEDSEQLWRKQCLLVRAVCQREVDRDRRHGLSWKVSRSTATFRSS